MSDILIKPNFLSPEECDYILNTYDVKNYQGNDMTYFDNSENIYNIKKMRIEGDIVDKICDKLNINKKSCVGCSIVYYPTGSFNGLHADNCIIDGNNITKIKDWTDSAIIFMNTDFNGGELVYPSQGLIINPTIGTLVMAPADHNYIHYVTKIEEGERYTVVLRFVLQ